MIRDENEGKTKNFRFLISALDYYDSCPSFS